MSAQDSAHHASAPSAILITSAAVREPGGVYLRAGPGNSAEDGKESRSVFTRCGYKVPLRGGGGGSTHPQWSQEEVSFIAFSCGRLSAGCAPV